MKVFRKVLAVVLSVAMVFLGIIGTCAVEISGSIRAERNAEATSGYTKMMDYFGAKGITIDPVYPEGYGGAYIDGNDNLVVQVVENDNTIDSDLTVERLSEITGLQTFIIQYVKYSFNDLIRVRNVIGALIPKLNPETGKLKDVSIEKKNLFKGEIVQTGIEQKSNSVVVWLDDISQESIDDFRKNVTDAPFLKFKQAHEERPAFQVAYESGDGWVTDNVSIYGSIGFPATYGSYSGFVTAWHCTTSGPLYLNDLQYGSRVSGSYTYDYAFVNQTNNAISITRGIYGTTKSLNSTYVYLAEGSAVGRTGYATGFSTGTVTEIGIDNPLNMDLITTNCGSMGGDSGGPYFGSPSYSQPSIAGIHIGGYNDIANDETFCLSIAYLYNAGYRIR